MTFTQNSGEQDLIARLVFRRDLPNRTGDFVVLYGTPAADPQAPELTRTADIYELGLLTCCLKLARKALPMPISQTYAWNHPFAASLPALWKSPTLRKFLHSSKAIFSGAF